jgi:alkylhydroperoxidase domain protein
MSSAAQDLGDVVQHHVVAGPDAFTQESLGWLPWLEPLPVDQFDQRHWDGVVQRERAAMPYFALLARQPEVLRARTLLDLDVFGNEDRGLPRAERELAATAASVLNGCVFCASVHARAASGLSGREQDVQRLLDEGTTAALDERWDAVVALAAELTATPVRLSSDRIRALADQGLDDAAIADAIAGAAFFNWANRLMLSLGEPTLGRRRRPERSA